MAAEILSGMTDGKISAADFLKDMSVPTTYERMKEGTWTVCSKGNIFNTAMIGGIRGLLQGIGEGARKTLGQDVWVNHMHDRLCQAEETDMFKIIIDDCRYPNESDLLRKHKGVGIHLYKEGSDGEHSSEKCQLLVEKREIITDYTIHYNDGLDKTQASLKQIINQH